VWLAAAVAQINTTSLAVILMAVAVVALGLLVAMLLMH
jgi:hypothetical protein